MNKQRILSIVLIGFTCVFAIHTIYMQSESARVDLTEENLYSLTDGTKEILAKMGKEGVKPIDIKLYFSAKLGKSLPRFIKNFITYESYIRNLLKEYERNSDGKIRISFVDPMPDSDEAQDAVDYGLEGKLINQYGDQFFFGMVFQTQTGSKDVIEFLWPEKQESIEYEISKKIYNLIWPTKKRIAIISSLEPVSDNSNPYMAQMLAAQGKEPKDSWTMMKLLEESYTLTMANDRDHISKDEFDLLLVIHPKALGDKELWAIDEWVITGGNTIVLTDNYCLEDKPPTNPNQPWAQFQYSPSSNLDQLLEKWGLEQVENAFVADFELGVKRPSSQRGPAMNFIYDLNISEQNRNVTLKEEHPIFQGLNNLRFFLAGELRKKGEVEHQIDTLITSTDAGSTITIKPGFPGEGGGLSFTDLGNPAKIQDSFRPGSEPVAFGYLLQGKLPSAFPEGATFPESAPETPPGMPPGFKMPPSEDTPTITKEAVPEDQKKDAVVAIFSDVDFITDQLAFQRSFFGLSAQNDNNKLLQNTIDFLLGSKELMKVRARHSIDRPFKRFDEIEARADQKLLERERKVRADIENFQAEIREKQGSLNQQNAALFQKKLQDEVDNLNKQIADANRELREIRKLKRGTIEAEEAFIRYSTLWTMPTLVMALGLFIFFKRKKQAALAQKGGN